jgi:multicomponent Na+:H+ antiporter subunit D
MPVVAGLFVISAVSLAGIPPTSGFFGKILLFDAGFGSDQNAGIWFLVFGLIVSFGTVFSMTKIWNNVFWGSPDGDYLRADAQATTRLCPPRLSSITTGAVVASVLLIAVFAGPLLEWCQEGAEIWFGTSGESALEVGNS